jgi:RIO-like serine/threonine protein kinase
MCQIEVESNILSLAHDAMTKVQVLHGDLSPNNFILHEGTGYFIDFDHAAILEEGSTSISSFGTVSLNAKFHVLVVDR